MTSHEEFAEDDFQEDLTVLNPKDFYDALLERKIRFFSGVPDSCLKDICAYMTDNVDPKANIITANEGCAIGLAAGHYLATGSPGLVYMQNSGLGNCVNPLTSLADSDVYGIPMLLVIGWRGEPGKKDEPQHVKMGKVTFGLLNTLGIDYAILPESTADMERVLEGAAQVMSKEKRPYAIVVRKGTFEKYKLQKEIPTSYPMSREEAIECFIDATGPGVPIVSTTGKASRELFELREQRGESHETDFLTVGSMGHSSHIALGAALQTPDRDIYCLDGDGAAIMHMGGLSIIASVSPTNYKHIVLNNGVHDSVGGQPTVGFDIDLCAIALASGYKAAYLANNREELIAALAKLNETEGPALLEIRVKKGARAELGRPTMTPKDLKRSFMKTLGA